MHSMIALLCESLDALGAVVVASTGDNRTLTEWYGWNCPAVTRHELAAMAGDLAVQLRDANVDDVDNDLAAQLQAAQKRVMQLQTTVVPQIFSGNAHQAAPAYMCTLSSLNVTLRPILGWQNLVNKNLMPAPILKKLRYLNSSLDEIVPRKEELQARIKQIEDATDAAESLPTDLQSLKEARMEIDQLSGAAKADAAAMAKNKDDATASLGAISQGAEEASKLVKQCEEAYRITTTKGLAAAFDQRASRLGWSMWVWVVGLLVALSVGAYLGAARIKMLTEIVNAPSANTPNVWLHLVLSVFSIAAPVWFAWLATKQIGQRFRLYEDYAFKASVAKAYEGYRREAARIDEAFEARLFSSALERLEEAPLRLVETETPGSPWHELISSPAFQTALNAVPELKDKFVEIAKAGMDVMKARKG